MSKLSEKLVQKLGVSINDIHFFLLGFFTKCKTSRLMNNLLARFTQPFYRSFEVLFSSLYTLDTGIIKVIKFNKLIIVIRKAG
jgi:hypothetical protein